MEEEKQGDAGGHRLHKGEQRKVGGHWLDKG